MTRNTQFNTLLLEVADGIATVTLNRPEVLNAVNTEMREDFLSLMDRLFFDDAIRVVIFTGAGKAFSAGADISHFEKEWHGSLFRAFSRKMAGFFDDLEALEKPVIAAINGAATGMGLDLALACDLRFASTEATMGFRQNAIGLIPSLGGCVRFARLIGIARAKELIFTGAMISAEEAERIGLVNRVYAPERLLPETRAFAETLLQRAPQALGLAKRLLNTVVDMDHYSGIIMEDLAQSILMQSEDHREGLRAFREKRKPQFKGR